MDPLTLLLAAAAFSLLGTAFGVLTGLTPGLHVNNVAAAVVIFQGSLIAFTAATFAWAAPTDDQLLLILASLIVGTAVAHTFLDFVPSIFLGAPEGETALSVLPGHRMLLAGEGYEAVRLSAQGALLGVLASFALLLPLRLLLGSPVFAYDKLRLAVYMILVLVVALLVLHEPGRWVHGPRARPRCHVPEGVRPADEPPTIPIVPLASLSEHEGEAIAVRGVVDEVGANRLWLRDETGRSEILLDGPADVQPAAEVLLHVTFTAESVWSSANRQRMVALGVFLLAGTLGLVVLGTPGLFAAAWYPIPSLATDASVVALFPLFTGLFGLPTLLLSVTGRPAIPPQRIGPGEPLPPWRRVRAVAAGTAAGSLVSWFPGVSGSSATVVARLLAGGEPEEDQEHEARREFLMALGAVNTASTVFVVLALFVILRARSGAMHAVSLLLADGLSPWEPLGSVPLALPVLLLAVIVSAVASFGLTLLCARWFARWAPRANYGRTATVVIAFLLTLLFLLTGPLGLLIAATATATGLLPPYLGVRRVHLMGCLLLPVIAFLL